MRENIPGFPCLLAPAEHIIFCLFVFPKCHGKTIVSKRIRGDFSFHLLWGSGLKNKEGSRKINFIILRNNHWNSRCEYIHYYTMLNAVHQCTSICLLTTSRYYPLKGQAGEDLQAISLGRGLQVSWSSQNPPNVLLSIWLANLVDRTEKKKAHRK